MLNKHPKINNFLIVLRLVSLKHLLISFLVQKLARMQIILNKKNQAYFDLIMLNIIKQIIIALFFIKTLKIICKSCTK